MMRAFGHYLAGFLPGAGGMLDQAATFVDAIDFLISLKEHHMEIDLEKR